MLAAAGALGLLRPALAQSVMPTGPRPTGYVAAAPSGADRLSEIRVELAWLGNAATFSLSLQAEAKAGTLEAHGYVPSAAIRDLALQLAQRATRLPVVDRLQIHTGLALSSASEPADTLRQGAVKLLAGSHVTDLAIGAGETGQVVVEGVISSEEERLAISKKMKGLRGCTCVVNRLRSGGDSTAMHTIYAGSPTAPSVPSAPSAASPGTDNRSPVLHTIYAGSPTAPSVTSAAGPASPGTDNRQPIALVIPAPRSVSASPTPAPTPTPTHPASASAPTPASAPTSASAPASAPTPAAPALVVKPLPTLPVIADRALGPVAPAPSVQRPSTPASPVLAAQTASSTGSKSEVLDLLAVPGTPAAWSSDKKPATPVVTPPAKPTATTVVTPLAKPTATTAVLAAGTPVSPRPQRLDLEPTAFPLNSARPAATGTAAPPVPDSHDTKEARSNAVAAAVMGRTAEKPVPTAAKPTQLAAVDSRGSRFAESLAQPVGAPSAQAPLPTVRPLTAAPSPVVAAAAKNDSVRSVQSETRSRPTAIEKPQPASSGAKGVIIFDEDLPPLPAARPAAPQPIAPAQLRLQVASVCGNLAREVQVLPAPDQSLVIRVKLSQPSARDELARRIFSLPGVAGSRVKIEWQ
jgi:hypothetical protein